MAGTVDVIIEVPRGSRNKFDIGPDGRVWFDRRLPGSVHFPADYGFVPATIGSDGEPLDALVLMVEPTYPGVHVRGRAIGCFWVLTGHGREAKLVVIPEREAAYAQVDDLTELPDHQLAEITHFFDIYRNLDEDHEVQPDGHGGAEAARRVLDEAFSRRQETNDIGEEEADEDRGGSPGSGRPGLARQISRPRLAARNGGPVPG
jgi:inorganic pyrophosphatase